MGKIKLLLALFLIALTFVGCNPDDDNGSNQNDDTFAENFGNAVSKDFIGQVVDSDNHPIQNATVKIGTATVQTDVNGVFIVNGASVYEKFAYITAKKAGYFDGSRALVPTSGKNHVKIMLVQNAPTETIQSGVASEVSIYSGTKVKFDGAFQDENGNPYSGTVSVALFHLSPSDENIDILMPGMLYAQTSDNKEAVLQTFGMLNVELRGSAGQKLNISNGHTAEITLRIDDNQMATAPSSIPLWHFDEEKGYWKEDGLATKVGNNYVGEVSHFSWWNCDVPFPTIRLTVSVVDSNGNALPNMGVGLNLPNSFGNPFLLYTDNNGQVSGIVPAQTAFIVSVHSICGDILYSAPIGPLTSDTVHSVVISGISEINMTTVTGNLKKCDNTNVTNGYVLMQNGGVGSIAAVTNGTFSLNTIVCPGNATFTLKGFDFDNLQTTATIIYNFTLPVTDVGTLTTCNIINEFVSYQVDNNPMVITNHVVVGTQNNGISLAATSEGGSSQDTIYILGNTQIPGLYTTNAFTINFLTTYGTISPSTPNTMQFNLTQCGAIGTYMEMTFSGTFNDSSNVIHTLTGTVHAGIDY